jgi:ABC-2 type transport system permease protein
MKLFRDTWLIFVRNLMTTIRNPVWVFVGLLQPVYFLVLFAPLLISVAKTPGFPPGGALNVFTPGLLIQLGLFGSAFVGFTLISELREGVVERMRVTPVSRFALLLGRALRDILILLIQSLILVLAAWPFGLTIDPVGLVITLALIALMGLMMASCSYALALALKSEDALAPLLNTVTLPLMLLSGIMLPISLAPAWLRHVASVNPLTYAVDASRDLFNGHPGNVVVPQALVLMTVLAALAVWWAARSFRHATA